MDYHVQVDNIKCGGCAASITKHLSALHGVESVQVDIANGTVHFVSSDEAGQVVAQVKSALLKMGYPESGSLDGVQAVGAKAKSFVSCAVGKMSKTQ